MKQMLSNIDLFAVVTELNFLEGSQILNVYEYGDRLLLKLRTRQGKKMLLIDPKKRVHLTEFKYPMPKIPTQFCMVLRKYMKKRRIRRVYQHHLDRIFIIELGGGSFGGQPKPEGQTSAGGEDSEDEEDEEEGEVEDLSPVAGEAQRPGEDGATEVAESGPKEGDSSLVVAKDVPPADNAGERVAPWKFVVELFSGGNYFLLNEANKIFLAKTYKIVKDRRILAKQDYLFPPARGTDIDVLTETDFQSVMAGADADLVRTIARHFNMGGDFAEEICATVGIPKNTPVKALAVAQLATVFGALKTLHAKLAQAAFSPVIVCTPEGAYDTVVPFQMKNYAGRPAKAFPTFNAAVDEFFGKGDVDAFKADQESAARQSLARFERILQTQRETITEQEAKAQENQTIGELVYAYLLPLEELLATITKTRQEKDLPWETIRATLAKGKEMGIPSALLFENFKPAEQEVVINLEGHVVAVPLSATVHQIADHFFSEVKKARHKIEGTRHAIADTERDMLKAAKETEKLESRLTGLGRLRKKKWYEKFHWFFSSDGFLVIAGRDASANEAIVKKHMEKHDLFFHADVKGAPVCVVKNPEGVDIPQTTISEAATLAGCYSRAWRFGWGDMAIYYVRPEQVSKSPPSGEFLGKGSFFISGKKNTVPSAFLKLAIALEFEKIPKEAEEEEDQFVPYVIGGPESAIKKRVEHYVAIKPLKNGLTSGALAGKIKTEFLRTTPASLRKWADILPVDEIVLFIPAGNSTMS